MGYRRLKTLGDAQRHGFLIQITCANVACARQRDVTPYALISVFGADAQLDEIGPRLRCQGFDLQASGCGHKGAMLMFVDPPAPPPDPDPPDPGGTVLRMAGRQFRIENAITKQRRRRA